VAFNNKDFMARAWWTDWNLSYLDDSYGPLYGGHSVQEAFYNTLQKYLPDYIAQFNRGLGSDVLMQPYEYRHRPEYRTLPRMASAAVLVEVPATAGHPQTFQSGIRANWMVEVMVYVYGTQDWQETQALTQAYAACVRACIIQNRGLGGFAETTTWDGEQYIEGEHSGTRTTGVAHISFTVTVGNAMNIYGGLPSVQYAPTGAVIAPSTAEATPVPTVVNTNVQITKEHL
jgi:hypothetical protein